ncbi:MAG: hypothetical protein MJA31_05855 [Clostridia bacterium]|nr:hypothetical protein [Clostridia bacterium]
MADEALIITGGLNVLKVLCSLLAVVIITTMIMFRTQKDLLEDDNEIYDVTELEQ